MCSYRSVSNGLYSCYGIPIFDLFFDIFMEMETDIIRKYLRLTVMSKYLPTTLEPVVRLDRGTVV